MLKSTNKNDCPSKLKHTPCPEGYLQWHLWANEMNEEYYPVRCEGCGLYSVWVKNQFVHIMGSQWLN